MECQQPWDHTGYWSKSTVIPGTPKDMGPPYGKRDPYHSHIFRDSKMGVVWEAYHKGVPLLGVPENPIDPSVACKYRCCIEDLGFWNPHPLLEVAYALDDKIYTPPKINTFLKYIFKRLFLNCHVSFRGCLCIRGRKCSWYCYDPTSNKNSGGCPSYVFFCIFLTPANLSKQINSPKC